MNCPLVSILIPTYNGAAFIKQTIDSVLNQSIEDWEIIVMDDASSDNTIEIAASFKDHRIKIHQPKNNVGAQRNWNRGLALATGKYFKLLPQDDLLATDCLAKQIAVLEQDSSESIALVFSSRNVIKPDGTHLMVRGLKGEKSGIVDRKQLVRRCIQSGANIIGEPGNGLMRLSLVKKIGEYTPLHPYVIDLNYWFRALQQGDAYYINEALTSFRVSGTAWSTKLGRKQIDDYCDLAQMIYQEGHFGLSKFSLQIGSAKAHINSWLRIIYYKVFL